ETVASGISSLPFSTFVALMQPIHLAIGIVEGVVTAAVVSFVAVARPEIIRGATESVSLGSLPLRNVFLSFLVATLLTGGVVSWFASENPDGLEWAIAKVTGSEEVTGTEDGVHSMLAGLQEKLAFLPDYSFKENAAPAEEGVAYAGEAKADETARLGTSVAGGVGALLTLVLAFFIGFILKRRQQAA
ncbi:MAG: PDGLE domain-containing protein, partial [Proteobacteria bacterium]|nr:PDGLE domain-containing protein [Pseudomonadota bacterium]